MGLVIICLDAEVKVVHFRVGRPVGIQVDYLDVVLRVIRLTLDLLQKLVVRVVRDSAQIHSV